MKARNCLPSTVQGTQMSRQVDGRGTVTPPDAFCGILGVAFHCQEIRENGSQPWILNPEVFLFGGHGGKQRRVLRDSFVGRQQRQKMRCHVVKI